MLIIYSLQPGLSTQYAHNLQPPAWPRPSMRFHMLLNKAGPVWAIWGLPGTIWTNLVHSVRPLTIQGHCQPFWALFRTQPFWTILQHSGPFLKAISSPYLHFADRFLVKNTFPADRFYGDHRSRETKQELMGGAKRRPPKGPEGPLGPWGGPMGPPMGPWGGGWGVGPCGNTYQQNA